MEPADVIQLGIPQLLQAGLIQPRGAIVSCRDGMRLLDFALASRAFEAICSDCFQDSQAPWGPHLPTAPTIARSPRSVIINVAVGLPSVDVAAIRQEWKTGGEEMRGEKRRGSEGKEEVSKGVVTISIGASAAG